MTAGLPFVTVSLMSVRECHVNFSRAAPHYDEWATVQKTIAAHLARMLSVHDAPRHWLDVACGTGALYEARCRYGTVATGRVMMMDCSHAMMREVSSSVGRVVGDVNRLAVRMSSFDLVTINMGLHWMDDGARALEKLASLVADGGLLAFSVPLAQSWSSWRQLIGSRALRHGLLPLPCASELDEWLRRAHCDTLASETIVHEQFAASPRAFVRQLKMTGCHTAAASYKGAPFGERAWVVRQQTPLIVDWKIAYRVARRRS